MPDDKTLQLSEAEIDQQATEDVLADARDLLAEMEIRLQQIRTGSEDQSDAATAFLQHAANLRLKARTVDVPGLGPLTHRLEDYLAGLSAIEDRHINDLQTFADKIADVLDGEPVSRDEVAAVVRELPKKAVFELGDIVIAEVDVTLVMPQRSAARIVQRELAACGYLVHTILDPFEALELIVETKPDFVITSMVMAKLSGVDLACALAAMPTTRRIPVALLTSMSLDDPSFAALPPNVGIIRRGPHFGDDLAHVLERFNIT